MHGRAERLKGGAGPHPPGSHVIAGGVDQRVEGGHEPVGGHVGPKVAASAAAIDELAKAPVRGSVGVS
jgi:hypothetical protein